MSEIITTPSGLQYQEITVGTGASPVRGKQVTVRDLPQREHIDVPVREQLIVELYSK